MLASEVVARARGRATRAVIAIQRNFRRHRERRAHRRRKEERTRGNKLGRKDRNDAQGKGRGTSGKHEERISQSNSKRSGSSSGNDEREDESSSETLDGVRDLFERIMRIVPHREGARDELGSEELSRSVKEIATKEGNQEEGEEHTKEGEGTTGVGHDI